MKTSDYHRYLKTNDKKYYALNTKHRNQSKTACRKSYSQLEKSFSKEVKSNLNAFFKYTSKTLNYSRAALDLRKSNETISKNQEKAELFNTFFTNAFTKEESATTSEFKTPNESNISCVSQCVKSVRTEYGPEKLRILFYAVPFTADEVLK